MITRRDELETGCVTDAAGFTSIVVALDLESGGDHALPVARVLAEQGGIPVELLTVSSPNVEEDIDVFELTQRLRENGWPDDGYLIVHDNHPGRAIVDVMERRSNALLVMAARASLAGPLRLRVVDEVLAAARQPVLLVGPHAHMSEDAPKPALVVCADRTDAAVTAVPAVARWAATFGASDTWVTEVVPTVTAGTSSGDRPSEHVRHLARLLADVGVESSWVVLHGDEPDVRIEEFGTQLRNPIFVSTSGRWTDGRRHWHSTTRQLVRRSTRPVLVVPADPTPTTT
jgi:nucleotide-binding universal stress UspA family protein